MKREHQIFTDLLDAVRALDTETPFLMEGEEVYGTIRLYELLNLYCENEFEKEVNHRQEDRKALAEIVEPTKRGQMSAIKKNQAVLRFYRWLADQGFVSHREYKQLTFP